jgi:hypothetical protein
MVARSTMSPADLEKVHYERLMGRAALAAQVGPFRRVFGVMKQVVFAVATSKVLSQNSTRDRILFVTVSVLGTLPVVFNKSDSDGVMGQRVAFSDNIPGANINYLDFILYPGDELHATAGPGALQVNEQSF